MILSVLVGIIAIVFVLEQIRNRLKQIHEELCFHSQMEQERIQREINS